MLCTLILLSFIIGHVGVGPTKVLYMPLVSLHLSCMFVAYSLLDLGTETTQDDPYNEDFPCYVISQILASCLLGVGIFLSNSSEMCEKNVFS